LKLLRELILGRKFEFESQKNAIEFIADLKSNTTNSSIMPDGIPDKLFIGRIKGNKIRLRRHVRIRKAFTPILSGKIIENSGQAILKGRISLDPFIQMILFLFMVIMISVSAIFIIYSEIDEAVDLITTIPLFFILLFLVLIMLMARMEIDSLEENLTALLKN